jgi:hypothetical protein
MRASGWPVLTCGSSDSGSEPEMYRSVCPSGGSALPKYGELSARVVLEQPSVPSRLAATATETSFIGPDYVISRDP